MNLEPSWLLVLVIAIVSGAGCVWLAAASSRRLRRKVRDAGDRSQVGAWENEGGNLPPPSSVVPADVARSYRSTPRPRLLAALPWRPRFQRAPSLPPLP